MRALQIVRARVALERDYGMGAKVSIDTIPQQFVLDDKALQRDTSIPVRVDKKFFYFQDHSQDALWLRLQFNNFPSDTWVGELLLTRLVEGREKKIIEFSLHSNQTWRQVAERITNSSQFKIFERNRVQARVALENNKYDLFEIAAEYRNNASSPSSLQVGKYTFVKSLGTLILPLKYVCVVLGGSALVIKRSGKVQYANGVYNFVFKNPTEVSQAYFIEGIETMLERAKKFDALYKEFYNRKTWTIGGVEFKLHTYKSDRDVIFRTAALQLRLNILHGYVEIISIRGYKTLAEKYYDIKVHTCQEVIEKIEADFGPLVQRIEATQTVKARVGLEVEKLDVIRAIQQDESIELPGITFSPHRHMAVLEAPLRDSLYLFIKNVSFSNPPKIYVTFGTSVHNTTSKYRVNDYTLQSVCQKAELARLVTKIRARAEIAIDLLEVLHDHSKLKLNIGDFQLDSGPSIDYIFYRGQHESSILFNPMNGVVSYHGGYGPNVQVNAQDLDIDLEKRWTFNELVALLNEKIEAS